MLENNMDFKRWYDEDSVVGKCITTLETLQDSLKRQTSTYLMDEIINKPPFVDMLPDEVFNLATSETRKRRWYDFDEVTRIFVELLRYSPSELRREISIKAITFVEDLSFDKNISVEIEIPEKDKYLDIEVTE